MKAPVIIFAYRRLDHLKLCIEHLQKNPYASETKLFIFSDGPKNENMRQAVADVRSFLKSISGFMEVHIIEQSENLGLKKSIITGVTQIVNQYEKVIVVEDDIVVSKYFLKYMNTALDKYQSDDRVISVHGYVYPVKEKLPDFFFLRGADCWGWATWKRGWDLFQTDGSGLLQKIQKLNLEKEFNLGNSYPYMEMLKNQIAGRNDSWAILWHASAFVENKLTLYPGKSYVKNIGNDNSGTHSAETTIYDVVLSDQNIDLTTNSPAVEENAIAVNIISEYFRTNHSLKEKVKKIILKIFRK